MHAVPFAGVWEEMIGYRMTPENVSAEGKCGLSLLFSGSEERGVPSSTDNTVTFMEHLQRAGKYAQRFTS